MLLNCLLAAYPENGLELYKTYDYWTCRELLDAYNSARINPEDKIQENLNKKFNKFLCSSDRKYEWSHVGKQSLYQIYKKTLADTLDDGI